MAPDQTGLIAAGIVWGILLLVAFVAWLIVRRGPASGHSPGQGTKKRPKEGGSPGGTNP